MDADYTYISRLVLVVNFMMHVYKVCTARAAGFPLKDQLLELSYIDFILSLTKFIESSPKFMTQS